MIWAMNGSETSGGVFSMSGLVASSATSLIREKKRRPVRPWMTT
jgi:hypothetical protein